MNAKILGTSFTLTSNVKMEDIVKLKKFSPESLILKTEKGEPRFSIGIGSAAISAHGITFNGANQEDLAQVTLTIPTDVEDKQQYVADQYGLAMLTLSEMEDHIAKEMKILAGKFETISKSITTVE